MLTLFAGWQRIAGPKAFFFVFLYRERDALGEPSQGKMSNWTS